MPKRTAILLLLFAAGIVALARMHWWTRDPSLLSSWARSLFEDSSVSAIGLWAATSRSPNWLKGALLAAAIFFVIAATVFYTPIVWALPLYRMTILMTVPNVLGTILGSFSAGRWLANRGLRLERPIVGVHDQNAILLRFSLRELFFLTLAFAILLGISTQASFHLSTEWQDELRYMLALGLLSLPDGLVSGVAASAMWLPGPPWRRMLAGIPVCAIRPILLGMSFRWSFEPSEYLTMLSFQALLYLVLLVLFWTWRSAGYRLVWREHALLADNPVAAS